LPIRPASAALAGPGQSSPNACADAGTPENAVVHFYLALSKRDYGAAFQCLSPSFRQGISVAQYTQGYATTVSDRLLIADRQADGTVRIDLHAVDRTAKGLVESTFMGPWTLGPTHALSQAAIRLVRQVTVPMVPTTAVDDIFAFDKQHVLQTGQADVTGEGIPAQLYLTGDAATRHVWVFQQGRLIFAETNGAIQSLGANGHPGTLVLSSASGRQYWRWSSYGFIAEQGTTPPPTDTSSTTAPVPSAHAGSVTQQRKSKDATRSASASAPHSALHLVPRSHTPSRPDPRTLLPGIASFGPLAQFLSDTTKNGMATRNFQAGDRTYYALVQVQITCPSTAQAAAWYAAKARQLDNGVLQRDTAPTMRHALGAAFSSDVPMQNGYWVSHAYVFDAGRCAGKVSVIASSAQHDIAQVRSMQLYRVALVRLDDSLGRIF
jgi:hypothetical protein